MARHGFSGGSHPGPAARPAESRPLRLGTRGSELAIAQSSWLAHQLSQAVDRPVELVEIVTPGDTSGEPVMDIGTPGVFVSTVRHAVQLRDVDLAVHSLKDLPTDSPDDLVLAAIPVRADPRDALVSRDGLGLVDLPQGARIGTSSLRRMAELKRLGLPLQVVPLRGNVNSRLQRVACGEIDGIIVAAGGLARLNRLDSVTEFLEPSFMVPAPGQGALAVECRTNDIWLRTALAQLDHWPTRVAVTAERTFLAALKLGCSAPVGAYAVVNHGPTGTTIHLDAVVCLNDQGSLIRVSGSAPAHRPGALGRRLAKQAFARHACLDQVIS